MERIVDLSLDQVTPLIRNRLGLILGPGACFEQGIMARLSEQLANHFQVELGRNYIETSDEALEHLDNEAEVRDFIRRFFGEANAKAAELKALAKVKWNAVLSCALDDSFDTALKQHSQLHPLHQEVTVISSFPTALPPRSLPVLKLLGGLSREDYAYSTVTYATRRARWGEALRTFADLVQDHPIVCLGMAEIGFVFLDILAQMSSDPHLMPSNFIFLASDPILSNSKLYRFTENRTRILPVAATVGELVRSAKAAIRLPTGQPRLPFRPSTAELESKLELLFDVAVFVNGQLRPNTSPQERNRLLDALFSPASVNWEPFAHNLDFPRSAAKEFAASLKTHLERHKIESGVFSIIGSAASGKTTLLKRLAFDLATSDEVVFWLRPSFYQDTPRLLGELFDLVAHSVLYDRKRLFVFMDDPLTFGSLGVNEVAAAASASGVNIVLVMGVRASDWHSRDANLFLATLPLIERQELPDDLDKWEWDNLPEYLVKLGVAPSKNSANQQVAELESRSTRDSLSTLYWLIPSTKASITGSIKDEFQRLGDSGGLSRVIIGNFEGSSELLRDAYGMVAVADSYRAPLPVEVLVSALGVGYEKWISATPKDGAVWGLLYSDQAQGIETVRYRTRNSIVTEAIVHQINGGSLSHSGELLVLEKLLRACTGTQPAYREFAILVLIPHEKLEKLSYAEGLSLFDTALKALPFDDKTLAHHRALWIRKKGGNPIEARGALQAALATENFPYASRSESDAHIYTSLAANEIDIIDRNLTGLEKGKLEVLRYLEHSRSENLLDPKSAHVEARLMLRLIKKVEGSSVPDTFSLIGRTLNTIDEMLILLKPQMGGRTSSKDADLLSEVREQLILETRGLGAIDEEAENFWERFQRQEGFELAARLKYKQAMDSQKGKAFKVAIDYCNTCIAKIETSGSAASVGLREVYLQIYYQWRIGSSSSPRSSSESIDWNLVERLSTSIPQGRSSVNPLYKYLQGLALCHLGEWGTAETSFAELRRMHMPARILWQPRDQLKWPHGGIRVVQGEVKKGTNNRQFLWVEELKRDFLMKGESFSRAGEIAHAYIRFAFGGPSASPTLEKPVRRS
jgi:hypothetical protein